MLWYPPIPRFTRSGKEFAALSLPTCVSPLQDPHFDFTPLVAHAVAAEHTDQEDHEDENASDTGEDTVDDVVPSDPLNAPRAALQNVAAANPPPLTRSWQTPHTGPHQQRPAKPHRLTKKHAADTTRRKKKRLDQKQQQGHVPTTSTIREHVQPAAPVATDLDTSALPAARVKDTDKRHGSKVRRSLSNLLGLGFQLVEWDGCYGEAVKLAFQAIRNAGAEARFSALMHQHRHGLFAAVNIDLSYGKGQRTPSWLHAKEYTGLAEGLLANHSIQCLAGFADAVFALWVPRLYQYYRNCDAKLRDEHVGFFRCGIQLRPQCLDVQTSGRLESCVRVVATLSFGTWGLLLDSRRAHSSYSPPPVAHSNVPVQDNEEHVSFTQFSAGGIFRYVDNGCQTVEELAENDLEEYERLMALKATRWEEGLKLFSTITELLQ
ncbi:hypothetical protein DFH07DRAFT_779764 [Mycena maculata]|uniref:Uncharacterized protein n=1 Tax=Mycena maculata TaxID=230809 RepID=A0AAD7MX80_9AGAR|nr:hypothetical protein DFH07DRAFT_779764 [Mycena maculata]